MPGADPAEACRIVFGELPELPYLPELPDRGPGADLVGRTAALLVDMPAQTTARGWKLADRPGRDLARAHSYLSSDLDALEERAEGYAGPLKIQICGPLTLAASLELSRGSEPALSDPGALADIAGSLAEGLAAHAADVRKRVPGATLVVQLDEPSLPAALAGRVPSASGLNVVAATDPIVASQRLGIVARAPDAFTVVHCCAEHTPFPEIAAAGADAAGFDLSLIQSKDIDLIAERAEAGLALFAGALPAAASQRLVSGPPLAPRRTAEAVVTLWRRTGLATGLMTRQVVITPACGLARLSPAAALAALSHCREAARIAAEMIEELDR